MKFVLITQDADLEAEARQGFHPSDTCMVYQDWRKALERGSDANMMFVDMLATLDEPHQVAGYERFAVAKMNDPSVSAIPLVLISPPETYEMDFVVGWPDFIIAHFRRPIDYRQFRRASTWV